MNYSIKIGNEYTGYAYLVICLGGSSGVDYTLPITAGIGIVLMVVVVVLVLRRSRA
ncbi:MAG: hypothetical protein ACW99U_10910 [Candidatus Thorarchaeota archaeon]|jgi:hypothetical protein